MNNARYLEIKAYHSKTMSDIIGLAGAYGMEIKFERPEESKVRLEGNGTFVDIWVSKRGITFGVYDPQTRHLRFMRKSTLEKIEDSLARIQNGDYRV